MKKYSLAVMRMLTVCSLSAQNKTDYVDPFNGSDFHGHTFPGATYPFGMVQLSPDTRLDTWDGCSGYHYSDSVILGFSHTHLSGTGCLDYGDILFMPVSGYTSDKIDRNIYSSSFSHKREAASPGYYEVYLEKPKTMVRLTSGRRAAMHSYKFKKGAPQIVIDLKHRDKVLECNLETDGKSAVYGFRSSSSWAKTQSLYFYAEFSQPYLKAVKQDNGALFEFGKAKGNEIRVRIGISAVSVENAKLNLESEINDFDFEALKASTEAEWEKYLNKIDVRSGNEEYLKTFYTSLYHTAMHPNVFSDVNGEFRGHDQKIHKAEGYEQYTVFSLWDTYRALHPLFTIIEPARTVDFLKSFQAIYDYAGKLPVWELAAFETDCMIGFHSIPVIVDAMAKGIGGFDEKDLFEAMIVSSRKNEYGINVFNENGLVVSELEHESVSKTLEYAYDDWCIAQAARMLIDKEEDVAQRVKYLGAYNFYSLRGQYYKNQFDPETGFMRPKVNGGWLKPFAPTEINNHFTEGNSWQYSFYVPQDVYTHVGMLGGDDAYYRKLDSLFTADSRTTGREQSDVTGLVGQYAQGNEPSHHAAYLFPYVGKQWRTAELAHKICTELFDSTPAGICGNDDCGQMSAWYVFSSMGFYPVCPGTTSYVLGSPLFDKVSINLENGKVFTIDNDAKGIYIDGVTLNGEEYTRAYIDHNSIADGGSMKFRTAAVPTDFAAAEADCPVQKPSNYPLVINPYFVAPSQTFTDPMKVEIKSVDPSCKIWYAVDGGDALLYSGPITITESCRIEAWCENASGASFKTLACYYRYDPKYTIDIKSKVHEMYQAEGPQALIDGIRGTGNYRLGHWQSYQGQDFEAVVDLQEIKPLSAVGAGFLQDVAGWIMMPQYAEFYLSEDGKNFRKVGRVDSVVPDTDTKGQCRDYLVELPEGTSARYVKVFAKSYGKLPEWHLGAGGDSHIFIDEIVIR